MKPLGIHVSPVLLKRSHLKVILTFDFFLGPFVVHVTPFFVLDFACFHALTYVVHVTPLFRVVRSQH